MGHIKLISILLFFLPCWSSASQIETQIEQFIKQVEYKRLQSIYPNARIEIGIQNKTALSYLPECDHDVIIDNQRPEAVSRTSYSLECRNPTWKSYVPVTQEIFIKGIKAIAPIQRGGAITPQNTGVGEVNLNTIRRTSLHQLKPSLRSHGIEKYSYQYIFNRPINRAPRSCEKGQQRTHYRSERRNLS